MEMYCSNEGEKGTLPSQVYKLLFNKHLFVFNVKNIYFCSNHPNMSFSILL